MNKNTEKIIGSIIAVAFLLLAFQPFVSASYIASDITNVTSPTQFEGICAPLLAACEGIPPILRLVALALCTVCAPVLGILGICALAVPPIGITLLACAVLGFLVVLGILGMGALALCLVCAPVLGILVLCALAVPPIGISLLACAVLGFLVVLGILGMGALGLMGIGVLGAGALLAIVVAFVAAIAIFDPIKWTILDPIGCLGACVCMEPIGRLCVYLVVMGIDVVGAIAAAVGAIICVVLWAFFLIIAEIPNIPLTCSCIPGLHICLWISAPFAFIARLGVLASMCGAFFDLLGIVLLTLLTGEFWIGAAPFVVIGDLCALFGVCTDLALEIIATIIGPLIQCCIGIPCIGCLCGIPLCIIHTLLGFVVDLVSVFAGIIPIVIGAIFMVIIGALLATPCAVMQALIFDVIDIACWCLTCDIACWCLTCCP